MKEETNVLMKSENFTLIEEKGKTIHDKSYHRLKVLSEDLAEKYVVAIEFISNSFLGDKEKEQYYEIYVNHGMRSSRETLEQTREYINVLEEALSFAKQVEKYCQTNDWWE